MTSSQDEHLITIRRDKVRELLAQGESKSSVCRITNTSITTINRDIVWIKEQARDNIKRYADEIFPEQYQQCLDLLATVTREASNTAFTARDNREKISALSLVKDCVSLKADLLSNVNLVDRTIAYVEGLRKKNKKDDNKTEQEEDEQKVFA
ncbi:MAG: hypothetical protein DLM72_14505 [Candidatus Nitrosopolaris wilkensis]|nr:MAG: hypothetical protein DLM72_14505 [Candidatus Nitrosopolaris wilkensis]